MAYRNIIFNKVYTKLGISYKLIDLLSTKGYFTKYHFVSDNNILKKSTTQNLNVAFTLSSSKELLYATFGFLNISLPWANNEEYFPNYTYIKLGNFVNLFNGNSNNELSLLVLNESYTFDKINISYYLTVYNILRFSRNFQIKYGGDIGYKNNNYICIKPSLIYSKPFMSAKSTRRGYFIFKISADFSLTTNSNNSIYKPAYLFNILYVIKNIK